jgi:uncharacterized protein YjiK
MFQGRILPALLLIVLSSCTPDRPRPADPFDILFPYQETTDIDSIDFKEPSGIVFHSGRGTLFVVGDEGDLAEFQTDGSLAQAKEPVKDADFEGITYNPATGLLYAVTENEARIFEIDPGNLNLTRELAIEPFFEGERLLTDEDNRVEAITFAPDPAHPEGMSFYLANNKSPVLDDGRGSSIIFEIEVPLSNQLAETPAVRISAFFSLPVKDVSGLHYDPTSDHLYVLSDVTNSFFEVTRDGAPVKSYAFPGEDQEGITVDNEGVLYFVQDSGGIIKVR